MITQSTPVLYVASIEPSLDFFTALGFDVTADVPEIPDDPTSPTGFVILTRGDVQLMLQSWASGINDMPKVDAAHFRNSHSFIFMRTDDLDRAEAALAGHIRLFDRRTTFYGATEIGWREPGGHIVVIAQFSEE
jgi:catechol 2,3-dioxygenase-like lactoylglutathione lyase family enzyme